MTLTLALPLTSAAMVETEIKVAIKRARFYNGTDDSMREALTGILSALPKNVAREIPRKRVEEGNDMKYSKLWNAAETHIQWLEKCKQSQSAASDEVTLDDLIENHENAIAHLRYIGGPYTPEERITNGEWRRVNKEKLHVLIKEITNESDVDARSDVDDATWIDEQTTTMRKNLTHMNSWKMQKIYTDVVKHIFTNKFQARSYEKLAFQVKRSWIPALFPASFKKLTTKFDEMLEQVRLACLEADKAPRKTEKVDKAPRETERVDKTPRERNIKPSSGCEQKSSSSRFTNFTQGFKRLVSQLAQQSQHQRLDGIGNKCMY